MIKIEDVATFGWEQAIYGMRNPMNSWDKIDTERVREYTGYDPSLKTNYVFVTDEVKVGKNDLSLMHKLANAGTADHRKFMRMIVVYVNITAPLYWWKEFDTYKVGTVANSCSTMHKIAAKEFTIEDFSHEHLIETDDSIGDTNSLEWLKDTVYLLNLYRDLYLKTKDKKYWWQMIQLLPSSYNQKRTVMLNYEVLRNMYTSRHNHKLDEWRIFCKYIAKNLPHSELITQGVKDEAADEGAAPSAKDLNEMTLYLRDCAERPWWVSKGFIEWKRHKEDPFLVDFCTWDDDIYTVDFHYADVMDPDTWISTDANWEEFEVNREQAFEWKAGSTPSVENLVHKLSDEGWTITKTERGGVGDPYVVTFTTMCRDQEYNLTIDLIRCPSNHVLPNLEDWLESVKNHRFSKAPRNTRI